MKAELELDSHLTVLEKLLDDWDRIRRTAITGQLLNQATGNVAALTLAIAELRKKREE